MRFTRWITLGLVCALLPALGQAQPGEGQPRGPRDGRRADGERPALSRLVPQLAEELQLTDDQREQVEKLVKEHAAKRRADNPHRGETRELLEALRAAQDAGDEDKVAEIRQQLREQRRGAGQPMAAFFDDLEEILTDEQKAKLPDIRERLMRGRGDEPRGISPEWLLNELPQQLELTDEQQAQFDQLAAEMKTRAEENRARNADMRTLMSELRTARRDGDDARVQELEEQLRENRPHRGDLAREFLDELEGILTAEQKDKLAEALAEQRGGRPTRGDPRAIFAAARELDLSAEQREQLKQIAEESRLEGRELPRGDRAAMAKFADSVRERVKSVLSDEQNAQIDDLLKKQQRRPRGEPGREGRRPQPRGAGDRP